MENYKPNSIKYREEQKKAISDQKKVTKVVNGPVQIKKRSEAKKLADIFITEDISKVKDYVVNDLLIPTIKQTAYDIFTNGLSMLLFGETGHFKKNSSMSVSKVSYRDYNNYSNTTNHRVTTNNGKSPFYHGDIILSNKGEVEAVLMGLEDVIDRYGVASVADLYDLLDISSESRYTDNNFGWTNISAAEATRLPNGNYRLKLPKAMPID